SASFDRWWNGVSLRAKVTGVTVFLHTLGLIVAGAGTMTVLRTYLVERVDEAVHDVAARVPSGISLDGIRGYGDPDRFPANYVAAVSAAGRLTEDNLTD